MQEITVKGIITGIAPQGEYGRRVTIISDRLGRVTAFAGGAAKPGSKLIGALRPFTAAEFTLAKGRSAYNIHGVFVMDSFSEISLDPELFAEASFIMESASYYSAEGMEERDSIALLNLMYLTLEALRKAEPDTELTRCIYMLRLLRLQGQYSEEPSERSCSSLWHYVLSSPLSSLYKGLTAAEMSDETREDFIRSSGKLFEEQSGHRFRSLDILREMRI